MDGRTHNISLVRYLYYLWSSFVLLFIWWKSNVTQNLIVWRLHVRVSLAWVKCYSQHELDQIKGTLSMFRDLCSCNTILLVHVLVANILTANLLHWPGRKASSVNIIKMARLLFSCWECTFWQYSGRAPVGHPLCRAPSPVVHPLAVPILSVYNV